MVLYSADNDRKKNMNGTEDLGTVTRYSLVDKVISTDLNLIEQDRTDGRKTYKLASTQRKEEETQTELSLIL